MVLLKHLITCNNSTSSALLYTPSDVVVALKRPDMPAAGVMEHVKYRGHMYGRCVCYHVTKPLNGEKKADMERERERR